MLRLAAVLLALLFAGCAQEPPAPAPPAQQPAAAPPDACGARAAGAQDAPLLPAFAQTPLETAKRLAAAVGDRLLSDEPELVDDGGRWQRWRTARGSIAVELARDGSDLSNLLWDAVPVPAPVTPEEANATLAAVLDAFGVDSTRLAFGYDASGGSGYHVAASRPYGDSWIEGESASYTVGGVHMLGISAFHTPPERGLAPDDAALVEIARAYARCVLDAQGRTEEKGYALLEPREEQLRWSARNGTLARIVPVEAQDMEGLHCGIVLHVRVAAAERMPLGLLPVACD